MEGGDDLRDDVELRHGQPACRVLEGVRRHRPGGLELIIVQRYEPKKYCAPQVPVGPRDFYVSQPAAQQCIQSREGH